MVIKKDLNIDTVIHVQDVRGVNRQTSSVYFIDLNKTKLLYNIRRL